MSIQHVAPKAVSVNWYKWSGCIASVLTAVMWSLTSRAHAHTHTLLPYRDTQWPHMSTATSGVTEIIPSFTM